MSLGVGVPALLVGFFGDGYLHVTGAQAERYEYIVGHAYFIYMGAFCLTSVLCGDKTARCLLWILTVILYAAKATVHTGAVGFTQF